MGGVSVDAATGAGRWRVGLVVIGLAAGSLVATARASPDAPGWSITPPAGWNDTTAAVEATPEVQELRQRLSTSGREWTLRWFASADGEWLQILHWSTPRGPARGGELVDFMAGLRKGAGGDMHEESYRQRRVGATLVADAVATNAGQRLYIRRIVGHDADRLLAVAATCAAAEAVCTTTLDTLTLDPTGLVPPAPRPQAGPVDTRSSSYRWGRLVGLAFVTILGGALLLRLLRRRRD